MEARVNHEMRRLDVPNRQGEEVLAENAGLGTGAENRAGTAGTSRNRIENRECSRLVGGGAGAELDFDRVQNSVSLDHEVDFAINLPFRSAARELPPVAAAVVGEVVAPVESRIRERLHDLADHEGLEDVSRHRAGG